MNSEDLDVLTHCAQWVDAGSRALLVTVVKTWGSSPRPEGAMLCIRDDGRVIRSLSGGCIEDDLSDRVRRTGVWLKHPEAIEYGVSADEAHRFGLPCGGTIRLVLEPVSRRSRIYVLLDALSQRKLVSRTLDMRTGRTETMRGARGQRHTFRRQHADYGTWSALPDAGNRRGPTVAVFLRDRPGSRLSDHRMRSTGRLCGSLAGTCRAIDARDA